MAAELDPSETPITTAQPSTTIPSSDPPQLDRPSAAVANPPKRQRRPSVRLGEIGGDSHYESQNRRPSKTWRFHKDPSLAAKTSKTRPLTNLVNGMDDPIGDFTHRNKTKSNKQPTKRVRTNWNKPETAAISNGGGGGAGVIMNEEQNENNNEDEEEEEEEEGEGEGEGEEDFREFEPEGSESPKQSPVNSVGLQFWDQRRMRSRTLVSESNGPPHPLQNDMGSVGVREWLTGLGLGRYTALFEIHEVDDEVLPLLTLDDLKDMGVNAVGSRRKMYNAILKLRKGFS